MRRTRIRRHGFFGLLILVWLAGSIATLAWFRLSSSADSPASPASLEGLADTVRVSFDTYGIPTVRASGESDAWRALGYLHAADRLWQLEYFRRIAAGRLSEIFGSRALRADRFMRTLDLAGTARRAVDHLAPAEREVLEAYSDGVNARLAEGGPWPPEFQILRFSPEAWTPEASLSVGLVMALDLSHWRRDVARMWAAANLDSARAAYLHPAYPEWGPFTLDGVMTPPPGVAPVFGPPVAQVSAQTVAADPSPKDSWDPFEVVASVSMRAASNAWVVGPSRTTSGNPILANDMHLALRAPSLWYVASIHADADDLHVSGFTLPGIPGVVVGFNRRLAWGATNAAVDDLDFVVEQASEDGSSYLDAGQWKEFDTRSETIVVRGGEPAMHRVRRTVRGPVLSDVLPIASGTFSAMFVTDRVPPGLGGLLAINRAASIEEFHTAAARFSQPHLNLVVASVDGRIGYRLVGSIPLRSWDGALPVGAATVGPGWPGMWPTDAHPAATEPERDFIATSNNLQVRGLDGAIGADFPAPFRILRLTQALAVRRDWTVESTASLQRDVRSLLADRTLGRAVAAARRIGDESAVRRLEGWDRKADLASHAAPLFYSWFFGLRARVAADEWGEAGGSAIFPTVAMLRVLDEGDASPWVDDVNTPERETLADLEDDAMREAIARVGELSWGAVHRERHVHPLGRDVRLDRLFGFNIGPYPSDGGPNTLRPDDYAMWNQLVDDGPRPPWTAEYGPTERFVVELTPQGPRAFLAIPTGQSGNPFSSHYRDMNETWREGRLLPMTLAEGPAVGRRLTLVPRPR